MRHISAYHHTKEDGSKEELIILQDNLDDQVQKNTKIFIRREITFFVDIVIMITQITWNLLTHLQEIRSGFGLGFILMSGFGNTAMWSYGIWAYSLLPISKSWSLTSKSRHGDKSFQSLTLLRKYFTKVGCVMYDTG